MHELTIIIPSFNRQSCVLRQMRFWRKYPVDVHILDGSETSLFVDEGDGNVRYHHHPIPYEERIGKAVDYIDTPYTVFLCDDEYFIPRTLDRCINELKDDKELVACMGLCMRFYTLNNRMYGAGFNNVRLDGFHLPVYYAVQKSEVWKKSARLVSKHRFSCAWVQEFQFEQAVFHQGKTRVIDELMWLRNTKNKPVETKGWSRKLEFDEWIMNQRYADEVNMFYSMMKAEGIDIVSAVKKNLEWYKEHSFLFASARLRNRMIGLAPMQVKDLLDSARIRLSWKPMMDAVGNMNVDKEQLKEIIYYEENLFL